MKNTESGISSRGDIEYAVEYVREGHFGHVPDSLHKKAFQLLRLIAATHSLTETSEQHSCLYVFSTRSTG